MTEYRIPAANWPGVERKLLRLAKVATKVGAEAPTWNKVGEEQVPLVARNGGYDADELGYSRTREVAEPGPNDRVVGMRTYFLVEVAGPAPKLAGWTFAATLQNVPEVGNILRTLPDVTVPERFRSAAPWCEYCQLDRRRKDTFVVTNADTGEWKQVGRNCLKDFLGWESPEQLASYAEALAALDEDLRRASEYFGVADEEVVSTSGFATIVAALVREDGWLSKSKAEEYGGRPTAERARNQYFGTSPTDDHDVKLDNATVTEADETEADVALTWARDLTDEELADNDFLWNLKVATATEYAPVRATGILAAVFVAKKYRDEDAREQAERPESNWFGEVKKRETWRLTVVFENFYQGYYGTTQLVKFADEAGNVATWFNTGSTTAEVGVTYDVTATVKAFDTYEDQKQTILTRAKLVAVEEEVVSG
jgi:hypothetical protein